MTTNADRKRIEFFFLGRCDTSEGKVGWELEQLYLGEKLKPSVTRIYGKVKGCKMPDMAGSVWSVEVPKDIDHEGKTLTIFPSTFRYERQWNNKEEVIVAQANDRTYQEAQFAKKMLADVKKNTPLDNSLEVLRFAYAGMNFAQRPAFLAMIMKSTMRGS